MANKYTINKYIADDLMSELICRNHTVLHILSRFGITLGFGDKTIGEVCQENNVNTDTFLCVVNLLITEDKKELNIDFVNVCATSLINYLCNSHTYYLDYRLPKILSELQDSLGTTDAMAIVTLNYFNEYETEVRKHMMYEENTVFPYIRNIVEQKPNESYNIDIFSENHTKIEEKLTELKNIIIKYCPTTTSNELNNALIDIFSCESDLSFHNAIEDYILTPLIKDLESKTLK